ncbi:hypothetical protein [Pedobacter sp. UBA5917]|jgi:hypothetical protein|uniref:hypothetical protein n=1 Tax=Pedobacter sp. UBA5917 TaxID=1947061 RepID=UPI0025E0C245|nr:hypothetical protein [Pedobacter sp. UBA5917]
MNEAIPVLNYSIFYPGYPMPGDPLKLIETFDLEQVILTMVALRNSLERNRYDFKNDILVQSILVKLPNTKAERVMQFLSGKKPFALVHSVVISKILVDLFKNLKNNQPKEDITEGEYEQRLLDLILIYNEHHYNHVVLEGKPHTHELVWSLMMMQDLSGFDEVDYARTGTIKHMVFIRFLQESLGEKYPLLEKSLKETTGLDSIYQFMSIFLHLFVHLAKREQPVLLLPQIAREDPNYVFLDPLGLIIDAKIAANEHFDIGTLFTRPFFRTSTGQIYVLDHNNFSLLVERSFIYLLHNKSNIKELLSVKNFNGLLSHFGFKYYEKFLIDRVLKSLVRTGVRLIPSDDKLLSDFTLIVNETDVFIMEVKSVAINYRVFDEQNPSEFRKYIDEQFREKKGLPQLVRNIEYLINDQNNLLHFKKAPSKLNVYPIIVFSEPQMATFGVADYVGEKAKAELAIFSKKFKKIQPLTMIHSDFFVENIELMSRDRGFLKKLIESYHKHIASKKEGYRKFSSPQNYVKSMVGFDKYVIGKSGAYRMDQKRIFAHLSEMFRLKDKVEYNISD